MSRPSPTRAFALGAMVAIVAILGIALLLIAGGDNADDSDTLQPTTPATAPTAGSVTTSTTSAPATTGEADVRVYFAHDELLATAGRTVAAPAVARGALRALLEGPTELETEAGMTSAIPSGTELLGVSITDGQALVDLSGAFATGGGSLSMQLRVAQVVFTVTQFPTVETVTIELDGHAVDAIGGEGVDATDLTRADFDFQLEDPTA